MTTPSFGPAMQAFNASAPPGFMQSPMMAPMNTMFSMLGDVNKQQYGNQTQPQAPTILGQSPMDSVIGKAGQQPMKQFFGQ